MGCIGGGLVFLGLIGVLFGNAALGAIMIGAGALCYIAENSSKKGS